MMPTRPSKAERPETDDPEEQIRRLGKRRVIEIPKMLEFHEWLDGKRLSGRSC